MRYLSDEWIDEFAAAARRSEALKSATADARIRLQQRITTSPFGDVEYWVDVDHGEVTVGKGAMDDPDVVFEQDYLSARAVSTGSMAAQTAFKTGKIKLRGDMDLLMANHATFAGLDEVFADLRARTDYA